MKYNLTLLIVLFLNLFFTSCSEENIPEKLTKQVNINTLKTGFDILESNCFTCHSPDANKQNGIAPPMFNIKKHYNTAVSKQEFIANIVSFVENPSAENSIMKGSIDKFGLMPRMGYSKDQITAVATYLYTQNIEEANWFEKHYKEEQKKYSSIKTKVSYLEKGQKLAMQTKSTLGKNLKGSLKKGGTDSALQFCKLNAYSLVDSMATHLNAKIKRVSDKARNFENTANSLELEYITVAKKTLANGQKPKAIIKEVDGQITGYYPIMTSKMCLQCHGTPETEIKESTMSLIGKLYPEDMAINYSENELRAIWVVEFDK